MKRRDFIKIVGVAGAASAIAVGTAIHTGAQQHPEPVSGNLPNSLTSPFDLVFGPSGRLFVTDPPNYCVFELDSNLSPVKSFGKPGAHIGRLNFPKGIACDEDGLLYVVDTNNSRVQLFDNNGQVKSSIGSIGSIGGAFSSPQGVYTDSRKRMLVADTRNHRIQIYKNFELMAVIGDLGDGSDQFRLPTACAYTPENEIVVLDSKHGMVKFFGEDLTFRRSFGSEGSAPGQLNLPQGMSVSVNGDVWIADTGNHRIQQFSNQGKLMNVIGREGSGAGDLKRPTGLALREGFIYVADSGNKRINRIKMP